MKLNTTKSICVYEYIDSDSFLLAKKSLVSLLADLEKRCDRCSPSNDIFWAMVVEYSTILQEVFDTLMASVVLTMYAPNDTDEPKQLSEADFFKIAWQKLTERFLSDDEDGLSALNVDTERYIKHSIVDVQRITAELMAKILCVKELDESASYYAHYQEYIANLEDYLTSDDLYRAAYDVVLYGATSINDQNVQIIKDVYVRFIPAMDVYAVSFSTGKLAEEDKNLKFTRDEYVPDDMPPVIH